MQQFTVPQFIDVEDKIIGPITTRQFVILLATFIVGAIFYKLLDFGLFLVVAIIMFIIAATFAFAKINGRPFHYFVENFITTSRRPHLRVWSKEDMVFQKNGEVEEEKDIEKHVAVTKKPYQKSRLNEVSLIVDTSGSYRGEEDSDINIEKM